MSKLTATQPTGPETQVNIPVHENLDGEGRLGVTNFEMGSAPQPPSNPSYY
jgi:hypothetical protein